DGQTVRAKLGQAISRFVTSDRNTSKITLADVQGLIQAIANNKDPWLFGEGGGPVNVTPPMLTWVQPAGGSTVRGATPVEVVASPAAGKMSALVFTIPDALANAVASSEDGGRTLRIRTALDVSALQDGPLALGAKASDDSGNFANKSLTVTVANHGPAVSATSPNAGATVRGTVTIAATANAQQTATSIASLTLLNPPPGAQPDALPAADALSIQWDTTQAPEGVYLLKLQATDSGGGATTFFVPV